ncbi:MAG: metallopeptidase TldD-related protein, partial [Xanthomonadales bacterium]|nr:metallopeptidase TldD-related protein [Xanthomonadales bacterium]
MTSIKSTKEPAALTDTGGAEAERARLESVASLVLERARQLGASGCEVGASVQTGLTATVRMREIDTVEYSRDRGVSITVYFGQHKGSASTADLQRDSIETSIETACAIARFTEADPCAGLADPELMAEEIPDLDLWHPWDLDVDQAVERAMAMEAAGLEAHPLITNSEGATVSAGHSVSVYANSHGFLGHRIGSRHFFSCSLLAEDADDKVRDYYFDVKRSRDDLLSPEAVGKEAAERAVARHGAGSIATCRVPVLFSSEMARGLFGHLLAAISGGNLYRGSSFLIDALGKPLFPDWLTIEEQPFEPRGLRSAAYDNEGVATRERAIVDAGVLAGYVLSSYSARKLGMQTTGNAGGVHNLTVLPGQLSEDELIAQMGRG